MSDQLARDVVVIGGGAAGLSGALLLSRARLRVTVVDAGAPRNAPAEHMHGFLTRDGMPPTDLVAAGRAEVARYGGEFVEGAVERVLPGFRVQLATGTTLTARRLLVTTGMRDELPDVPGVAQRWGLDVLQCPYCHGYEVRDQPLGVLGTSPAVVHQALLLRQWSDDVVVFEHTYPLSVEEREKLLANGLRIVSGQVKELLTRDGVLYGVQVVGEPAPTPRAAVFVFPRFVPQVEMLSSLGCQTDDRGFLVADGTGATTVRGVWAAGNVVNPRAQVITAAGAGAAAAMAIHSDLVEEDADRAAKAAKAARDERRTTGASER